MNNPYTVVIAEDEELLLNNLIQKIDSLALNFCIVGSAQTGEAALALVREHVPDLLITDIRMPVMDGMELLSRVSKLYPSVRSLIISGYSDFDYAKEAIRYQVNEYLLKPVDLEELRTALFQIKTQLDLEREDLDSTFALSDVTTRESAAEGLKEYIKVNYKTNFNLEEVVSKMNYSPDYVTKIFTGLYGMSPIKYAITLRIHEAQHLLIHNAELSIQQIGEIVGYEDVSYFSRVFKKYAGTSPGAYREKERREMSSSQNSLFRDDS